MEQESGPSQVQATPEEPVKSIEDDGKADDAAPSGIPDEQWRAMMDVVMAIYDYREEE